MIWSALHADGVVGLEYVNCDTVKVVDKYQMLDTYFLSKVQHFSRRIELLLTFHAPYGLI